MNTIGAWLTAISNVSVERGEQRSAHFAVRFAASKLKGVTAVVNRDPQTVLDLSQMDIQLPTQRRQMTRIIGFEGKSSRGRHIRRRVFG